MQVRYCTARYVRSRRWGRLRQPDSSRQQDKCIIFILLQPKREGIRCQFSGSGFYFRRKSGRLWPIRRHVHMTHKTGLEDYYIIRNNKKMRFGYTTGTCAAAASKAAAQMLLSGEEIREIPFLTPKGILLNLEVGQIEKGEDHVSCAVRKDAGDDPDMTDGLEIYSRVRKTGEARIVLDGGPGVGRVTKKGLEQPVGNAAINKVPRSMILKAVEDVSSEYDYEGGLEIIISVPGGEEAAKKTFNPRLGIQGGISILGTSGIVEPMSESALIKTIEVEMRQRVENGSRFLLVTPGNYGSAYLKEHMDLPLEEAMKCSNYVGETIDMAVSMGVEGILFVSHIGKFVKVAAGIMNTHSRCADARAEVLASNAIRAGISAPAALEILNTVTTDEALVLIEREGKLQETIKEITDRISYYLHHRAYDRMMLGAVIFSNEFGYLGETEKAGELMELLREQDVTDQ